MEGKKMKVTNFIRLMRLAFLVIIAASLYEGLSNVSGRAATTPAKTSADRPGGKPEASIDLATSDGAHSVEVEWRYSDTKNVEVDFRGTGPDSNPSASALKNYD